MHEKALPIYLLIIIHWVRFVIVFVNLKRFISEYYSLSLFRTTVVDLSCLLLVFIFILLVFIQHALYLLFVRSLSAPVFYTNHTVDFPYSTRDIGYIYEDNHFRFLLGYIPCFHSLYTYNLCTYSAPCLLFVFTCTILLLFFSTQVTSISCTY